MNVLSDHDLILPCYIIRVYLQVKLGKVFKITKEN